MGWETSDRRSRLPKDWPARRRLILERDRTCQLRTHCDGAPANEVDHRTAGDDHRLTNLQGVCTACHQRKTAAERPKARRPDETHPGAL